MLRRCPSPRHLAILLINWNRCRAPRASRRLGFERWALEMKEARRCRRRGTVEIRVQSRIIRTRRRRGSLLRQASELCLINYPDRWRNPMTSDTLERPHGRGLAGSGCPRYFTQVWQIQERSVQTRFPRLAP